MLRRSYIFLVLVFLNEKRNKVKLTVFTKVYKNRQLKLMARVVSLVFLN